MKKLTAGIFATLLAVVSTGAANAEIASKGYVDQQVGTKADAATVTTLQGTVSGHTSQIGTINDTIGGYGDIVTHDASEFATSAQGAKADTAVQPAAIANVERTTNKTTTLSGTSTDAQYPSAKAVWTAVQSVDANASVEALEGRVETLETASANHVVKNEAITGGTHTKITYDAKGLVTAGADLTADDIPTIPNTKVSGLGSLAIKSSVATADIASKAVTKEKLADEIVTSLGKADTALQQASLNGYVTKAAADAAYADIATETTASSASTNAQTALTRIGTLTDLTTEAKTNTVAAINEVAKEAADAATAAAGAKTAADTAQGDVDALEAVVNHETTGLAAAHTAIDAVEGRVTTAEGEIDTIQTTISKMATSEAVEGLKTDVAGLKTSKLDKATYDSQVGTVSAGNMGTTATTVVTAINEVAGEAEAAQSAAEAADSKAQAAQETANAAIPAPDGECADGTAKCVLTFNNSVYAWEAIARNGEGE